MNEEDKKKDRADMKKIYVAYASATAIVVASIIISFFIKQYLFDLSDCKYVSLIGTAIPTIGTLSFLGWEIQTWDGISKAEKLNKLLLKISYVIGIVLIILGTKF